MYDFTLKYLFCVKLQTLKQINFLSTSCDQVRMNQTEKFKHIYMLRSIIPQNLGFLRSRKDDFEVVFFGRGGGGLGGCFIFGGFFVLGSETDERKCSVKASIFYLFVKCT